MQGGKKLLGIVLVTAGIGAPAGGAVATFTPPSAAVVAGTPINVTVEISLDILTDFNYAAILIGSTDATDLGFAFHPDWMSNFGTVFGPDFDTGIFAPYAQDVFVEGDNADVPLGLTTLALGTVTIDTTGMVLGGHSVMIDGDLDAVSEVLLIAPEFTDVETIVGTFDFTIIPEPGALVLLAVGTLVSLRRKR